MIPVSARTPDLGVIERRELPHEFNGIEVCGWSIPGYFDHRKTCRSELKGWLLGLAKGEQDFPADEETVQVKAWRCFPSGGKYPLYTAQVKLPR